MLPVVVHAYRSNDITLFIGIAIFAFAGLVVSADRNRFIFNVRCVNWFHYLIGVSTLLIANSLK